ncbi:hypothetical protein Tsubulata_010929 [Turnera subulata]|uniref:Chalcone-flavonone isomerase family protein n=1 Tax=Turnera subulata TaxID=218843 RepID=A0A9Q0J1K1_9ROSI|nr:hypothetical protein Tsubulata_010929 [Turnera subulata]
MATLSAVTGVEVESITFPPTVKPPASKNTLFLGGAGVRGIQKEDHFVKVTAIGVYLEESAVPLLGVKWKGKTAPELTESDEFYRDIVTGPFEKFFRVTMIHPLTGAQYAEKVSENCVAIWKSMGIYTDEEAKAIQKFQETLKKETFPPGSSILFTQFPSGSLAISFSKDGSLPGREEALIENKLLSEAILETIIGKHGVSPAAKQSLAARTSELLSLKDDQTNTGQGHTNSGSAQAKHTTMATTAVEVDSVTFPPTVKPPASKNTLFLGGAGVRGVEIAGKFVKATAIGVYMEESAVPSLAVKWKGKAAQELTESVEFYRDIVTGPFEKFIRVTMILPLTGPQYAGKVSENCVAIWKSIGIYTDTEAKAIEKFQEVFKDKTFPPGSSILFTQFPSGSLAISFSKDGSLPENEEALIDNKLLSEAVLESIIGKHGVSPAAKQSLAARISELLLKSK